MKHHIFKTNKIKFSVLAIIILAFLVTSCEKVIVIDLNSKVPQLVIEGNITNQPGPYKVVLTTTANYNESNNFPDVSGALVTLSDDSGNSEILAETSAGTYATSTIQGTPGRFYTLKVTVNGGEYSAVSIMPAPVNIDTLSVVTTFNAKGSDKTIYVGFTDQAGIANYYRFIKIINGITQSTLYVEDDLLQDGNTINHPLLSRGQDETGIKTGDNVTIVLQTIDKRVYDYFRTLLQLSSGGLISQSTSPANPLTNISNSTLGYYNACSVTSKTIIIP
jgi:hypothetical protein